MSQLKLTADSGGGTVAIKGPASTTGNAALEMTVPSTASGTLDSLNRAGNILQIVKGGTGDLFSTTSTSYTDATGMSVDITTTGSNKVYLICDYTLSNTEGYVLARLTRTTSSTTTVICAGNTAGSRDLGIHSFYHNNSYAGQYITEKHCAIELDSPGAGTHTYKMQMRVTEGTGYLNSNSTNSSDPDRTVDTRTSSKIIVMEVAA